jgi:hypothetical protein
VVTERQRETISSSQQTLLTNEISSGDGEDDDGGDAKQSLWLAAVGPSSHHQGLIRNGVKAPTAGRVDGRS